MTELDELKLRLAEAVRLGRREEARELKRRILFAELRQLDEKLGLVE